MQIANTLYFYSMDLQSLFELLDRRRVELKLTQADVGRAAFDKAEDTSLQNIRRGASPSYERVDALAKALDLEFYIGPKRPFGKNSVSTPIFYGMGDNQMAAFEHAPKEERDKFFLPIPFSDKGLKSRKPGGSPVAFSAAWFDELGMAPDNLRFIRVEGAGVQGLMPKGALVMIDEADTKLGDKTIYAFARQGVLDVAEFQDVKGGKGVILAPQSPDEPPEFFTEAQLKTELRIYGKVVWFDGYPPSVGE